jgi:type I restriction enzyme S subunit
MTDLNEKRPGYKKTKVGWIPEEWECVSIGDGVSLISGQHVDSKFCSSTPLGTPYLTGPTCFKNGQVIQYGFTIKPLKLCIANDVLLTVKGSGTGAVAFADREYCISRQIMAVRAKRWSQNFVFKRFQFDEKWFSSISDGLIPGISREDILKHRIPLPPLPEQKKNCRDSLRLGPCHRPDPPSYRRQTAPQKGPHAAAFDWTNAVSGIWRSGSAE